MRVLLVDDDKLLRMMVADMLESAGHEVVCAVNGAEAWELLRSDPTYSLLITDWVMPEVDGLELCRRVRDENRTPYLPIILTTSLDQEDHLAEALDAGADAFLRKPVCEAALAAQIRVTERILRLEERLETRVARLEEAQERIERDLHAAALVQLSHLPSTPPELPGVEFGWVYESCHALGGDMFNIVQLDERHVGVYVLDVSGHGTSAALVSVSLSRVLVSQVQQGGILKHAIPEPPYYEIVPPAEVAVELNRRFQLAAESGHFCTFLYGILDVERRAFRYVSAGHPGPIHVSNLSENVCEVQAVPHEVGGGIPIGVLEDTEYAEEEISLEQPSQLILYTDGVTETVDARGEEFGVFRMLEVLAEAGVSGAEDRVQALRKSLLEFAGAEKQRDDVTIVGIGIR